LSEKKISKASLAHLTGSLIPEQDDKISLGSSTKEFKDAHFDGTVNIDSLAADAATLTAATIDGSLKLTNQDAKTGTYTAKITDHILLVDTTTAFTVTLPVAATATGQVLTIIKTDSAANACTLDGNGSEKIDASVTYVAVDAQYDSVTLLCDGSNWFIISTKLA